MQTSGQSSLEHDHTFGQDRVRHGERRTVVVAVLTAVTMVVEIVAGIAYGSLALLADGLHMGSHAVALGIAVIAYVYTRKHANDERFSWGTGKVNALGGYTGAVVLAGFAGYMVMESIERFLNPVEIAFNQAIVVALLGLGVNGLSVLLLGGHGHDHDHEGDQHHAHDHNLRSAYLHVLADALTSIAAIAALLGGKYFGLNWLDPVMGLAGSALIMRWSLGLVRQTSAVLLDHQAPPEMRERVQDAIEADPGDKVVDLHLWSIAPGVHAAAMVVVTHEPRSPEHYRSLIPDASRIMHATVEVQRCRTCQGHRTPACTDGKRESHSRSHH